MDHSAPINALQVTVLRWIADGCPDGVMTGYGYKTTARSLQGRRLVTAGVRGGTWRAEVTDAGRYYLEHGVYPSGMWPRSPGPRGGRAARSRSAHQRVPPAPRDAGGLAASAPARSPSAGERAEDLVARVIAAGGRLLAGEALAGEAGARVIAASRHAPSLPFGKRLRLTSQSWPSRAREVFLDEDFAARAGEQPVPVPQRPARLHPAAASYRDDADRHEVTRDLLPRAVRIVHALAAEAERRGHQAAAPRIPPSQYDSEFTRSLRNGQLAIEISGFTYRLRIREQQGPGGGTGQYNAERGRGLPRWRTARTTTFIPTGRLQVTVEHGYGRDGRPAEFRDTTTRALEDRLPAILRELEIRALEDDWRRQEQERKAAEKRQQWEQAMARARREFRAAALAGELTAQLDRFRLAGDIDRYLAGLRHALQHVDDDQAGPAAEWIGWITSYREQIDPFRQAPVMPADPDPSPEDLRPFLNGWNAHGPG